MFKKIIEILLMLSLFFAEESIYDYATDKTIVIASIFSENNVSCFKCNFGTIPSPLIVRWILKKDIEWNRNLIKMYFWIE